MINAAVRVPVADLFTSTYGLIVVAKVVALVVLGVLGALHRRRTVAQIADDDDPPRSLFVRFRARRVARLRDHHGIAVALSHTPPPPGSSPTDITPMEEALGYRLTARRRWPASHSIGAST